MKKLKSILTVFKNAGAGFVEDNAFKLSASLSYYTIFALGPLFIIIISLAGIFYGRDAVQGEFYMQLNDLIGNQAALQIQDIIKNIQQTQASTPGAIVGTVILIIGATGVFTEMQDSINYIWSVKAKPKKSWHKFLINRALSFSLVLSLGFLLLVSLIISALLNLLSGKLSELFPSFPVQLFQLASSGITLLVITALFMVIYKVLPDAIISWKDAAIGAVVTALLFMGGKYLIGLYMSRSNMGVTYGAAASIIIVLSWVYYSALILYYGAEYTKMYALHAGEGIRPKQTAVFIIKRESKEVPTSYLDT
ncbi:MAG: YihY/virulence factor BrkB family protein [Chitinophagaceae bacterium]